MKNTNRIETAVNNLLDNIDIVENPEFIELMTSLYIPLLEVLANESLNHNDIETVLDGIGEFVPVSAVNNILKNY